MKLTTLLPAILLFVHAALLAAELRVSAAASLADVMTEISAAREKSGATKLQVNLAGSNVLARQIEEGAPVDVFISADERTMDGLIKKNLILAGTAAPLLLNSLVVIAPVESGLKIQGAKDLGGSAIKRLALGDPAGVPAGVYARKWLEGQGAWESISSRVVALPNVRAALAAVAGANTEAGIVYRTDAATSKEVKIIFAVPVEESPRILYPAAVCKGAADPAAARVFLAYLRSPEAVALFRKYGFEMAAEPAVP